MKNVDSRTVDGFGAEWSIYDQTGLGETEAQDAFERYFAVFPWEALPSAAEGFDCGCGSGRWAARVAPRVGKLHCVDPSPEALDVARRNLSGASNTVFHNASADGMPFADDSMDFGYSLGVLHHIPDTQAGMNACVRALKPGAPFLVYLYYAFDNKPGWFRAIWRGSDVIRQGICRLPVKPRVAVTSVIAAAVYWPLARVSGLLEKTGLDVDRFVPLAPYRKHSFYTMRTDALDRFGTRLEQRFTRRQIEAMMTTAGLRDIRFSDAVPYWCAVGVKG